MALTFKKATKAQSRLRLALIGPAGSGKTYSALSIASHLCPDGKVAVIDSERGSASKYADRFAFDVLELDTYSPDTYADAIHAAESAGYACIVIDSLSHAWNGKDGAIEQLDKFAARERGGKDNFGAWRHVTPMQNRLVDTMLTCQSHVIATMRSKTEYVIEQVNGRNKPRKVGMAPVQRDGVEFEFDVCGDLDDENRLAITKTRCPVLHGAVIDKPGKQLADILRAWLTDGAIVEPKPITREPPPPKTETQPHDEIRERDGYAPGKSQADRLEEVANALIAEIDACSTVAAVKDLAPKFAALPKGSPARVRAFDRYTRRQDEIAGKGAA